MSKKVEATFHPSVENPYVWPWGQLSSYQLVDETVTVDGVDYDVAKIRALVLERHTLAMDLSIWRGYAERRQIRIEQLERRLDRADTHLRRRTAALVRLIAKKGPRLEESGPKDPPDTSWVQMEESGRPKPTLPDPRRGRQTGLGRHRFGW